MVPDFGRALSEGVRLFNAESFFECHEVWEDAWRPSRPPVRLFLQGLIHVAVSFHHERAGNPQGAARQMRKGLRKLAAYLPEHAGIDTWSLYRTCAARTPGEWFPRIESGSAACSTSTTGSSFAIPPARSKPCGG